jgi:uncharacterized protein YqgQ
MGFVLYDKENFRALRYYEREASAKSQVTRRNKEYVMALLKGEISDFYRYRHFEHAYCSWAEFETVLKQGHSKEMERSHSF